MTHIVCMKRTNVILDEELLEQARKASGERTYSATINRALDELVRRNRVFSMIEEIRASPEELFAPGYVETMWPHLAETPKKKRVSAHEQRVPRVKSRGHRSR